MLELQSYGNLASALDINDLGVVVGFYSLGSAINVNPVRWVNEEVEILVDEVGFATAINNLGSIAGYMRFTEAFILDTELHRLGRYSRGAAINDLNNQGVGVGSLSSGNPVIWTTSGYESLSSPTYKAEPIAINDHGWVTGYSDLGAILWRNGLAEIILPNVDPDSKFSARDINNRGQIVGYGSGPNDFAFLWEGGEVYRPGDRLIPEDSHFTITSIEGINENGQMIGLATSPLTGEIGFMLNPVPEPTGFLLLVGGWACLIRKPA
ncbi:MAG: hypothetical protein RLN76_09415 [Phycisphaeraceae bacterium]